MRQGPHPLALAMCAVAAAVAVVLGGYFGWMAVWVLTVEGDDTATTLDRVLVAVIAALVPVCLTYATAGLIRYCRGRDVRLWATAGVYLVGLLAAPAALAAYLANVSGG